MAAQHRGRVTASIPGTCAEDDSGIFFALRYWTGIRVVLRCSIFFFHVFFFFFFFFFLDLRCAGAQEHSVQSGAEKLGLTVWLVLL